MPDLAQLRELLPWDFASTGNVPTIFLLGTFLVPLLLAFALYVRTPPTRHTIGKLTLATTWNAVWLLALNEFAVAVGWWTFQSAGPQIGNVPVVLWLGWVLLWGPVAAQIPLRPVAIVVLLGLIDLVAMPLMDSVVTLHDTWLIGEASLLAFIAWPGLLLSRWLGQKDRLAPFVLLQVAMFTGILFWFIPFLTVRAAGQSLTLDVAPWAFGAVLAAVGATSIPALIAVHDFFLNGGSPWPWDTTDRPVLSGPYRYLRSPMQSSAVLVLVVATFIYWQWPIAVGAAASTLFATLFCQLEGDDLHQRFGEPWSRVISDQRRWVPSWKPHPNSEPAVLWVNQGCESCSPIADFLSEQNPTQLEIRWAHEHPSALTRLRYERGDGSSFDGVAAFGACLEHLNLGYAAIGWLLRVPILWHAWQVIGDAVGFGPRAAVPASEPSPHAPNYEIASVSASRSSS